MTLFYPQKNSDFDLDIPLDKSAINLGVLDLEVSFRYTGQQWYMSVWYDGKYLTQNQRVQQGIDLLAKFSAYKLGKLIVYGDPTSSSCFLNWPVEVGYA